MRVVVVGASGNVGTSGLGALGKEPGVDSVLGIARRLPGVDYSKADGIGSSFYARHKAEVERLLDNFQRESPSVRVVRLRPALIFKREAASGMPSEPGWLDMGLAAPLMDSGKADKELGWKPRHSADHALGELSAGYATAPGSTPLHWHPIPAVRSACASS
jgi:hypothetical protein